MAEGCLEKAMDRITLSIKSMQQTENQEEGLIEFFTEGVKYEKDGHTVLEYEESAANGMKGMKTSITLEENRVVMERMGMLDTHFVFEKGRKFEGRYDTPFGNIKMDLFPTRVSYDLHESGGNVELEYELSLQDARSFNRLWLTYKNQGKGSVN